jgi:hypothetical protein
VEGAHPVAVACDLLRVKPRKQTSSMKLPVTNPAPTDR